MSTVPKFGGGGVKCKQCAGTVYASERIDYDGNTWHQDCFKCLDCKRVIGLTAVAMISGDLYCKNCFKRIFTKEGKYSSFGEKTLPKAGDARARSQTTIAPSSASSAASGASPSPPPAFGARSAAVAPGPVSEEAQALSDAIAGKNSDKVSAILKGLTSADLLLKPGAKGVTPIEQAFTGIANSRACGELMINWLANHVQQLELKDKKAEPAAAAAPAPEAAAEPAQQEQAQEQ